MSLGARHVSVGRNFDQYLRFKLTFGDEKRVVWLSRPVTIDALRQEIHGLYKCLPRISFIDSEGDAIPISNQAELEHVIEVFSQSPQSNLKLTLLDDTMCGSQSLRRTQSISSGYSSSFDPLSAHTPLPGELDCRPSLLRTNSTGVAPRCHSPPPGFLNHHQRSQSNSSSFLTVNGGGEFIPEHDENPPVMRDDGLSVEARHRSTNSVSSFSSGGTTSIESGFCDDKNGNRSRADTFPRSRLANQDFGVTSTYPRLKPYTTSSDGSAAPHGGLALRGSTATLNKRDSEVDLRHLSISNSSS
jgi:hypothetical protein